MKVNSRFVPDHAVIPMNKWDLLHCFTWQVAFAWNFTVVALFWSIVYDPSEVYESFSNEVMNIMVHAVDFGLIFIDLFLNKLQFYFRHCIYAIFIAVLYLIVNLAFVLSTNDPLYPVLF